MIKKPKKYYGAGISVLVGLYEEKPICFYLYNKEDEIWDSQCVHDKTGKYWGPKRIKKQEIVNRYRLPNIVDEIWFYSPNKKDVETWIKGVKCTMKLMSNICGLNKEVVNVLFGDD